MNIGGALGIAGKKPLGEFVWGETIIGICNGHLSLETQIALTDTGNEAYSKIVALEDTIQYRLLMTDLGTLIDHYDKPVINYVRFISVALSVAMAIISLVVTFHVDTDGMASEEKSALIVSLYKAIQTLLQTTLGI